MQFNVKAKFPKGYIADPYWPEREKLINIQKESGVNRARSQDKREKALSAYLESKHLTLEHYAELEERANRPFYTNGDGIVIPAHHIYGFLAMACDQAAAAIRLVKAEAVRSILECQDWSTGKTEPDGAWDHFVVVKSAVGKLSNQRSLRTNLYIEDFTATGQMRLLIGGEDEKLAKRLEDLLRWAGRDIGIGACRKMGWGRFDLAEFARLS